MYGDALVPGPIHGARGDGSLGLGSAMSPSATMYLDPDEYITEVVVCSDLLIRHMELATNKGRRTIGGVSNLTGDNTVPWCAAFDAHVLRLSDGPASRRPSSSCRQCIRLLFVQPRSPAILSCAHTSVPLYGPRLLAPLSRRYPSVAAPQWWFPNVQTGCDYIYKGDFSMPDSSGGRLLYFDSVKLKQPTNTDGSPV